MNHDNYADGFVRLVKLAAAKYVSQCELTYTLHGVPEYVASDRATAQAPTGRKKNLKLAYHNSARTPLLSQWFGMLCLPLLVAWVRVFCSLYSLVCHS
jgi:hypothetical protein